MPRDYPAAFSNQNTYGVTTTTERDRLPKLAVSDVVTFEDILVGKNDVPIAICLAGLQHTDDEEEVAKLVIGALMHASKTPMSKAKITNIADGKYSKILTEWVAGVIEKSLTEETEEDHVSEALSVPASDLPRWVTELEIPADDLFAAMCVESVELFAYAGVLAFAIGKQPDSNNLEAFNTRRRSAIDSSMVKGTRRVFVDESPALSLDVLTKVHRAFNLIIKDRALVMGAIVDNDDPLVSGNARMFYTIFRLSAGASLNPLLIITRFARKYPQFYGQFRDLETEYHATASALARFYDVPERQRLYLKVIFGNAYVPVDRRDVDSLLGVAVFTLQQSEPTLANYQGGTLSVSHREKLIRLLNVRDEEEEEVPEDN